MSGGARRGEGCPRWFMEIVTHGFCLQFTCIMLIASPLNPQSALPTRCRSPVVLPFYHSGMGEVMPWKARFPRPGNHVTVVVGEPVDLSHITCRCNREGEDQGAVWRDITEALGEALRALEQRVPPNVAQDTGPAGAVRQGGEQGNGGKGGGEL